MIHKGDTTLVLAPTNHVMSNGDTLQEAQLVL